LAEGGRSKGKKLWLLRYDGLVEGRKALSKKNKVVSVSCKKKRIIAHHGLRNCIFITRARVTQSSSKKEDKAENFGQQSSQPVWRAAP